MTQKYNYVPGDMLLSDGARGGEVQWGQSRNNDGLCTPSYNQYCPPGEMCGHMLVGCGAVAMGQVMWYWQWPRASIYRMYNWNLMTAELKENEIDKGNEIAHLLEDCGGAVNMDYDDDGSGTSVFNITEGFNNFNYYPGMRSRSSWSAYGTAWEDLIRSEIRAGRPVIYRGRPGLFKGHIFVIDGYQATDPSKFHINFGWMGSHNGFYSLNDITPANFNYNHQQAAIVGISPNYPNSSNENLYDVSYTSVSNTKTETARQNIALPANGKTLTVENGGNLTLIAGNSIILKPGFHAKAGSNFTAKIAPIYQIDKKIRITSHNTIVSPNFRDGINDYLCFQTENADSWEFQLFDRFGKQIWATAGSIENNQACVWDGIASTDQLESTDYWYILWLKNSYGQFLNHNNHFRLELSVPDCREGIDVSFSSPPVQVLADGSLLITPNRDGINDEVCFAVSNVAQWEARLINRFNPSIYLDKSGNASGQSSICVTDGQEFSLFPSDRHRLQINYKGTNGCVKNKEYWVYIVRDATRSAMVTDSNSIPEEIMNEILQKEQEMFFMNEKSVSLRSGSVITDLPETESDKPEISLVPNPTNGIFSVRASGSENLNTIKVENQQGKTIFRQNNLATDKAIIDISAQPSGVYLVTVMLEKHTKIFKVIKN